jgi:hypothetical protein
VPTNARLSLSTYKSSCSSVWALGRGIYENEISMQPNSLSPLPSGELGSFLSDQVCLEEEVVGPYTHMGQPMQCEV